MEIFVQGGARVGAVLGLGLLEASGGLWRLVAVQVPSQLPCQKHSSCGSLPKAAVLAGREIREVSNTFRSLGPGNIKTNLRTRRTVAESKLLAASTMEGLSGDTCLSVHKTLS